MSSVGSPYPPNEQFQQQAYQQSYQNSGYNANQSFNPNPNYNQGQEFNYNVNYPQLPKKKNKAAVIVSVIVIVIAALAVGAYFMFFKDSNKITKEQENNVMQKLISIYSDASLSKDINVDPESKDKFGSLASLIRVAQEFYSVLQVGQKKLQKELGTLDPENILTEGVLSDQSKIKKARDNIKSYIKEYKSYVSLVKSSSKEFKDKVKELEIPSKIKDGFLAGLEISMDKNIERINELSNVEEAIFNKVDELFGFLTDLDGKYTFNSEGQVEFDKDEDVNTFNKIFTEIQKNADKESEIQDQMLKDQQQNLDNLKSKIK